MTLQKVVIVGAGFGGLAAARALARAPVEVTLIDKRNHHLFQPLLYQVATAGLSPADIAAPIRSILRDQRNARVVLGAVTGIDRKGRLVTLDDGTRFPYDQLIVATGAQHSYFGQECWARHAPGIKSIEDATEVRRKVLLALERAEAESDPERRQTLLTFVVIGAGPTGVEMAGAIAELARRSVSKDFRSITPHCSKVYLVEAGQRILGSFAETLSAKAKQAVEELGVEVLTGHAVEGISANGVRTSKCDIATHTVVWAAGVQASPAANWLSAPSDRAGRVIVDVDLRVLGAGPVFAIGDTASFADENERVLPGIAPVAKQQGKHVARQIIEGRSIPFRYRDRGNLATIGRHRAVIEMGSVQLSGWLAWLVWCTAHIFFLVGFRNRFVVGANWLWNYLTFERGARLITGAPSIHSQGELS